MTKPRRRRRLFRLGPWELSPYNSPGLPLWASLIGAEFRLARTFFKRRLFASNCWDFRRITTFSRRISIFNRRLTTLRATAVSAPTLGRQP